MKLITSIWTTVLLFISLVALRVFDLPIVEQVRLISFDQYIQSLPDKKSDQIVVLNIGENSLEQLGQYPFPRQTYAQLISDLRDANAGMIAFTFMFPEADRFGGDEIFASWIKDNGIILAQDADSNGRSETAPYIGTAIKGIGDPYNYAYEYGGLVTNIPMLEEQAWGVGLINAAQEVDNITRRIPLISQVNNQLYPSFALEIIRVLQDKKSYTMNVEEYGIVDVMIPPYEPMKTDSNGTIWLNTNYTFDEIEYVGKLPNLNGKTVIVGLSAKGVAPQLPTPQGLYYPHQIQASVVQGIMDGSSISRPVWADTLEIALIALGGTLIILSMSYLSIYYGVAFFAVISVGTVFSSWYFWNEFKILLDLTASLLVFILLFTSTSFSNFYKQFILRQQIKKQFETYLDPKQVYLLQKNPGLLRLGGDRKEMSFLFMDICGFTPISEYYKNKDDPEGLVLLVNEFLDAMTKIILSNGGTIDKYMGDCIMAFWNAPLPCSNHAEMAVKSALEIEEKTIELKEIYSARGLPDINVGTGVNTGDCIVGNMGSESRFDYSVIGDAVNLAARLEATAARHEYIDYKTIISSFTMEQLPAGYVSEQIGTIKVKGKDEEITIYSPSIISSMI
jgi:adenylate cyclase